MFRILHALHTLYLNLPCVPWQALGQVGVVTKELSSGDVQVAVNGKRWIMNPCCLLPAPGDKSIVTPDTGTTMCQHAAFVLKPSLITFLFVQTV